MKSCRSGNSWKKSSNPVDSYIRPNKIKQITYLTSRTMMTINFVSNNMVMGTQNVSHFIALRRSESVLKNEKN